MGCCQLSPGSRATREAAPSVQSSLSCQTRDTSNTGASDAFTTVATRVRYSPWSSTRGQRAGSVRTTTRLGCSWRRRSSSARVRCASRCHPRLPNQMAAGVPSPPIARRAVLLLGQHPYVQAAPGLRQHLASRGWPQRGMSGRWRERVCSTARATLGITECGTGLDSRSSGRVGDKSGFNEAGDLGRAGLAGLARHRASGVCRCRVSACQHDAEAAG